MPSIFDDNPFIEGLEGFMDGVGDALGNVVPGGRPNFGGFSVRTPDFGGFNVGNGRGLGGFKVQPPGFAGFPGGIGSPFNVGIGAASPGFTGFTWASGLPLKQETLAPEDTTGYEYEGGDGATPGVGFGTPDAGSVQKQLNARGKQSPIDTAFLMQTAEKYGVPISIVLAHANQESGYGTDDNALTRGFNYFGLTGTGSKGSTTVCPQGAGRCWTFALYGSQQEGIEAAIRNMASKDYQNLTLRQYFARYLTGNPEGTEDYAGGLKVSQYVENAKNIIRAMGGSANENTVVMGAGTPVSSGGSKTLATRRGGQAISFAATLKGIDYTNGGIRNTGNPVDGMDCSSFAGYVLGLPRNVWNAQAQYDSTSRTNTPQVGDLVFFKNTNPNDASAKPVSHVGIYAGNGKMWHTGTPGRGVELVDLNTDYWKSKLHGYGRV